MMADFLPAHPSEVLREDFLKPLALSQYALANALGVAEIRISEIVNGKRAITPDAAPRPARHFGTSAEFWLGMQTSYDLELTRGRLGPQIDATVRPSCMMRRAGAASLEELGYVSPELPVRG
jgi:addiction module HigA family antidote